MTISTETLKKYAKLSGRIVVTLVAIFMLACVVFLNVLSWQTYPSLEDGWIILVGMASADLIFLSVAIAMTLEHLADRRSDGKD